jgi:hypothetical protein
MSELDLTRLGKLLGLLGSAFDAERAQAAQAADRLIRGAGMTWPDFVRAVERERIAAEAAQLLFSENNTLKAENEQLRGTLATAPARADDWVPVGDPRAQAQWCLDQHADRQLYLNSFEIDFLGTIAGWRGQLTQRQQPIFERILTRVTARGGRQPPA